MQELEGGEGVGVVVGGAVVLVWCHGYVSSVSGLVGTISTRICSLFAPLLISTDSLATTVGIGTPYKSKSRMKMNAKSSKWRRGGGGVMARLG